MLSVKERPHRKLRLWVIAVIFSVVFILGLLWSETGLSERLRPVPSRETSSEIYVCDCVYMQTMSQYSP
jgi:hypothetical protein